MRSGGMTLVRGKNSVLASHKSLVLKLQLKIVIVLLLTIFLFSFVGADFIKGKNYVVGDSVRIDLENYSNYTLRIETPENVFLKEGNKDIFRFELSELGEYSFKVNDEEKKLIHVYATEKKILELGTNGLELEGSNDSRINEKPLLDKKVVAHQSPNETEKENEVPIIPTQIRVGEPVLNRRKVNASGKIKVNVPYIAENVTLDGINIKPDVSVYDKVVSIVSMSNAVKEVDIENITNGTILEYYTPAPEQKEKIIDKRNKEVVISAPDYLGYKNVYAKTEVFESAETKKGITVYWVEENKYLDFNVSDNDNNGLIDEISFVVPHLSTQTFKIIVINKAEHLDEDRNFKEDIFDKVKALDNILQPIPPGDYVRIFFEKELTSNNDITIYAKSNSSNATIEVYEKDSTKKLATFPIISEFKKYQILLSELSSPQSTFDLLIKGGTILFDLIIDPSVSIFYEDWESQNFDAWTNSNWQISSDQAQDSYSTKCPRRHTCQISSDAVDTTDSPSVNVSFMYRDDDCDAGDVIIYFYDKTGNWDNMGNIDAGSLGDSDDTWNTHLITTTDDQYKHANFAVRFGTGALANQENYWIDNIDIIGFVNEAPVISSVTLHSEDFTNMTTEDLICSATAVDSDNDPIKNIYNWYKNGLDFGLVNMPFEVGSTSSTTSDYYGNYNGTVSGATFNLTGGHDGSGSYNFDGDNDWINLGDVAEMNAASKFTVSMWFNRGVDNSGTAADTNHGINNVLIAQSSTSSNDNFELGTEGTNVEMYFDASANYHLVYDAGIQDNTWYHLAVTFDSSDVSGEVRLYMDGAEVASWTDTTANLDNAAIGPLSLGIARPDAAEPWGDFEGTIDDFLLFDTALTPEQINKIANDRTDLIVPEETSVGDVYTCKATPNDGDMEGTSVSSNPLTVVSYTIPKRFDLNIISPVGNYDVYQNEFFNVTVNVTCISGNCGAINVTMDPIEETFEDFESDEGGFVHTSFEDGIDSWHRSSESSNDGIYSFKAGDTGTGTLIEYSYGVLSTPIYSMAENSTFSFYHYLDAEDTYDGGKLEYSVDGGTWTKVTSFISGGYNGAFNYYSGAPQDWTDGEDFWTNEIGTSASFSKVEVDLSAISGDLIQFRFEFGSDNYDSADEGWYIDSVNFTTKIAGGAKGIIPIDSGTPFYTTTQNPFTTNALNTGNSQQITFKINATGENGTTYDFFSYANITDAMYTNKITPHWNVTIKKRVPIPKIVGLDVLWPESSNVFVEKNKLFNVTLNVTCLSGECGTVNVTLDPIEETFSNFESGTESFEHFPLNAKEDQWHISTEESNDGVQSWKCGDTGTSAYASYSDSVLVSPTYKMIENSTFAFNHYMYTELGYDGGYLEYKVDDGDWNKVINFITGGYTGTYKEYNGGPPLTNGEPIWTSTVGSTSSFARVEPDLSGISGENIMFRFHFFADASVTREGWYIDSVNFTTETLSMDKGIIPTGLGTPFYTTATSNPLTTNALAENQSQLITFFVNATGELDRKYFFFAYANITSDLSMGNRTDDWNVTISANQELPNITINYPTAGDINDATPILDINLTSEAKDLWYNINGGANKTICSACSLSKEEVLYLREGNYTINVFVKNPMGEENSKSVSFNIDMKNNYYDSFIDSSYLLSSNGVDFLQGNVTLDLAGEDVINENFDEVEDWILYGGHWQLNSGELIQSYDNADTLAIYNSLKLNNITDYNVSFDMYAADNDQSGIVFAYEDPQNYYRCRLYAQTGQGGIEKVEDGSSSSLAAASIMYNTNQWNNFFLEIKNKTVSCYINGALTAKATNVSYPEGKVGIFNSNNLDVRYDNFVATITGGRKLGMFTSYSVKLINEITKFTNITWNKFSTNVNNFLNVEVSADSGNNWYAATKDSSLTIPSGNDFMYRVFFGVEDVSLISLLDLNVSWINSIEPAPAIIIGGITLPTEQDFTPMVNVTLVGDAAALVMSLNGGANQTVCTDCTGSQLFPIILEEFPQSITFYANNSMGIISSNSTNFNVDFGKHYYDEFLDNASIKSMTNVVWNSGNLSLTGGTGSVTSYAMNTSQPITRISHASWTETGVDASNTISLELSVDNGNTWNEISNGGSLEGFTAGSNLVYRFLYSTSGPVTIAAHDLNISWESPPTIDIFYPEAYIYNTQVVKINYSISYAPGVSLVSCWYSLDGGVSNTSMNCGDDVTGIISVDGDNTWTVYALDSSGMEGKKSITFSVDTTAPGVTLLNQTGEDNRIIDFNNPLFEGENLTLNINIDDSATDSVWVVIWEGVIGEIEKTRIFLENIFGNLWSGEIETDETFGEDYNYTVYANDTAGLMGSYNGTFGILKSNLNLTLSPNPNPGSQALFMTGSLEFSNGTKIANNAINFWLDSILIPFENLTNNGDSNSVLNFDKDDIKLVSTYDNVSYSAGEFTLDSSNTTGSFTGILDAGAMVVWKNVSWTDVAQSCSGTVDYQDGNSWGYSGTSDSYITSGSPTINFGDSSELTIDSSPDIEKAMIKFDDAFGFGENKVPYGATINTATLRLSLYDNGDNPSLYEILEDWNEDEVTSVYRTSSDLWSSEGVAGSPSRGILPVGTMNTATIGIKSLDISNVVSKWVARMIPNYGFIINPEGSNGIKFRSSEYTELNERPRLTVDFTASDCNGVLVYVRTSNDKSSWTDWRELQNGDAIADELGVSRYLEYRVEIGSFNSVLNPRIQNLNFNYTGTFTDANGLFNYSFITTDEFGSYIIDAKSGYRTIKAEDSATLSVQSGVPPEVSLISPPTGTWFDGGNVNLSYNAADLNGDFKSSLLILNGVLNSTNQSEIVAGVNNFTLIGLSSGTYNWSVNLSDIANTDASEFRTFFVDSIKPKVNLVYPINDSNFNAGFLNLSFNAYDNMDTVLSCDVTLDKAIIHTGIVVVNNTAINVSSGPLSGRRHSWSVTCFDEAMNNFTSETWEFLITDIPPTVTLVSPDDNYLESSDSSEFIYLPEDNSGIDRCELLINGEVNQTNYSVIFGINNSFNVSGMSDGIYNWTVRCYDLSNNTDEAVNKTLSVDLLPPSIVLVSPLNESSSATSEINFEFNVTDSIDKILDCGLFVDSVEERTFQATSGEISNESFSGLNDGIRSWRIDCIDNSSHSSSSTTWTVDIAEAPKVYMNNTNSTYTTGHAIMAEFTPVDNTQIASCSFYLDGVLNKTQSGGIALGVLNSIEAEGVTDGKHTYYIECTDGIGLSNVSVENEIFIDNSLPTIIPYFPLNEDVYSANVSFKFQVTDPTSQNLFCNLTVDSVVLDTSIIALNATNVTRNISGILDGIHLWNLTCFDLAGNTQTSATYNFTRYTAPGINLISPNNATWLNYSDVVFTYYPQDDEGFSKAELFINGEFDSKDTLVEANINNNFTKILSDGIYDWYISVTDTSLMSTTSPTRRFYVDTVAPTINLGLPYQTQIYDRNGVDFNFSVEDNLDDTIACDLYLDGDIEWTGEVTNASVKIAPLLLTDGNHTYQISCSDNANNSIISTETNFTVFSPPIITLSNPANKTYTSNSLINFSYLPEDDIGLSSCSIYFDGVLNNTDFGIIPNVLNNFSISGISEGVHNWSIECTDMDSNVVMSNRFILIRDITAPTIVMESPENDSKLDVNEGNVNLEWRAIDALDSFIFCDMYLDGGIKKSNILLSSNMTKIEEISGLSFGYHNWSLECRDSVGNINTSDTWEFEYSIPDFTVLNVGVNSSTSVEGGAVLINATLTNIGSSNSKDVLVEFYRGFPDTGVKIGEDIVDLNVGANVSSVLVASPEIGLNEFWVVIDKANSFIESDDNNNMNSNNVSVGAWNFFYGDINPNSKYVLGDNINAISVWNITDFSNGNIFVSDKESSIFWDELTPLGRDKNNLQKLNDFSEVDSLLGMMGFPDSIEELYLNLGIVEREDVFNIFKRTITNVPVTKSINSLNFETGILWDASDSADEEFDSSEKEDLVFVTKINPDVQGSYSIADYEIRVPARLRDYSGVESEAVFYVELL